VPCATWAAVLRAPAHRLALDPRLRISLTLLQQR